MSAAAMDLAKWTGPGVAVWILLGAVLEMVWGGILECRPLAVIELWAKSLETGFAGALNRSLGRLIGAFFVLLVLAIVMTAVYAILYWARQWSVWGFRLVVVYLVFQGLTIRGVAQSALAVYRPLRQGDAEGARAQLARISRRNIERLDSAEVIRTCVQNVAKNLCDEVVGPFFYAWVGGPIGLWGYKTIKTVHRGFGRGSLAGQELGWFADQLVAWVDFIPARLSGWALCVAAGTEGRFHQAVATMHRDGGRHFFPNRGVSAAAMAGALGVRLGGPQFWFDGTVALAPSIGDPEHDLKPAAILWAVILMMRAAAILTVGGGLAMVVVTGHWLS